MKVMCIENVKFGRLPFAPREMVIEGEIYTVKEIVHWYGFDWYVLEEMTSGWGWNTDAFILLTEEPIKEKSNFDKLLAGMLATPKIAQNQ
jgi:hypothetical protein